MQFLAFNKLVKYVVKGTILFLIGLPLAYLVVAACLSLISTSPKEIRCNKEKEVFVSSNGVHLDLIVPRELLPLPLLNGLDPPAWVSYLAFGWGDRQFYINTPTWSDLELRVALKAVIFKSESAMHVVWIDEIHHGWKAVLLCDQQLQQLMDYVDGTFQKTPDNQLMEITAAGYTKYDKFYEANGNFDCIHTCNSWVNRALKTAEVKTSIWSPFDKGVLYQVGREDGNNRTLEQ